MPRKKPNFRNLVAYGYLRTIVASRLIFRFSLCAVCGELFRVREHSHTRITRQPRDCNVRVTSRSRILFCANFFAHQSARFLGSGACFGFGQPCQKHPSTKTAIRSRRNTKSGLPNSGSLLRQPRMPVVLKSAIIRSSVSRLPRLLMRDITCDRFSGANTSAIGCY